MRVDFLNPLSSFSHLNDPTFLQSYLASAHLKLSWKPRLNIKPAWGSGVWTHNNNRSPCTVNTRGSPCLISDPCRAPLRRPLTIWSIFPSGPNPEADHRANTPLVLLSSDSRPIELWSWEARSDAVSENPGFQNLDQRDGRKEWKW